MRIQIFIVLSALTLSLCSFKWLNTSTISELPISQKHFKKFLKNFEEKALPYAIPGNLEKGISKKIVKSYITAPEGVKMIDPAFSDILPDLEHRAYFSRGSGSTVELPEGYPIGIIAKNETFTALIYKIVDQNQNAARYRLRTLDASGKIINTHDIGYFNPSYLDATKFGKVNKDLTITQYHFENKAVSYTQQYKIEADGTIVTI